MSLSKLFSANKMKTKNHSVLARVLLLSLMVILIGAKPAFAAVDLLAEYRFETD